MGEWLAMDSLVDCVRITIGTVTTSLDRLEAARALSELDGLEVVRLRHGRFLLVHGDNSSFLLLLIVIYMVNKGRILKETSYLPSFI